MIASIILILSTQGQDYILVVLEFLDVVLIRRHFMELPVDKFPGSTVNRAIPLLPLRIQMTHGLVGIQDGKNRNICGHAFSDEYFMMIKQQIQV